MRVKLNEVVEALESVGEEHAHYLDKRTGEIILLTSEDLQAAEEDCQLRLATPTAESNI